MHLADAFIQSNLQCIQAIHVYCQYVCSLGVEPTTFALLTQCSTTEPQEHILQKFQGGKIFCIFLKEVSLAYQDSIYLIKNIVKTVILRNIIEI